MFATNANISQVLGPHSGYSLGRLHNQSHWWNKYGTSKSNNIFVHSKFCAPKRPKSNTQFSEELVKLEKNF